MIHVDRSRVEQPLDLDLQDPRSPASKETAKAIAHIEDPDAHPKPKFQVYRRDAVKKALIGLFGGKCAYCEVDHLAATSSDIEHFRPKGSIDPGTGEERISPGYYWLAADWDNLLLACPGCNRSKRQLERNASGALDFADEATGKLDQFPLADEAGRVLDHRRDVGDEEPYRLLLDPCRDRPEEHLRYDQEGNIFARRTDAEASQKAETSIEVFALDRWALAKARKQKYLDMVKCWDNIQLAAQMIEQLPPEQLALPQAVLHKNEDDLNDFTGDGQEFAGMARWLIRPLRRQLEDIKRRI
ncbi:MAG: retron system putative HNH endonuclease [Acidobacteriota bacterium]